MADRPGSVAAIARILNPPVSWMKRRPVFSRLILLVVAAALLIVGLGIGDFEEIFWKGRIL